MAGFMDSLGVWRPADVKKKMGLGLEDTFHVEFKIRINKDKSRVCTFGK